jgi:hypothetical protein
MQRRSPALYEIVEFRVEDGPRLFGACVSKRPYNEFYESDEVEEPGIDCLVSSMPVAQN